MNAGRLNPARYLTRRGLGFIVVGLLCLGGAWLLGRRDLLTLSVFLLALPLIAVVGVRSRHPRFTVTRDATPAPAREGGSTTVRLHVEQIASERAGSLSRLAHSTASSAESTMLEALPPELGGAPRFHYPSRAARGGPVSSYEYVLSPPHRGLFTLGGVSAEFRDPFNLAWQRHRVDPGTELTVAPALSEPDPELLHRLRGLSGSGAGASRSATWFASASENDVTVREYRQGDALRRVHWPSTARRGELMVRQEEGGALPRITLILDRRRSCHSGGELAPFPVPPAASRLNTTVTFEWQVRTFLSLATALSSQGHELRVLDHTGSPAFLHSRSAPHPHLELLAAPEARELLPGPLAAVELDDAGERLHPGPSAGQVTVFTGKVLEADARELAAVLLSGPGLESSWETGVHQGRGTVLSCWPSAPSQAVREMLEAGGWSVLWARPDSPVGHLERTSPGVTALSASSSRRTRE
ncbi:DUF58 domain-containing protein [Arthrobacter sp. NPDC090010]|uniref:DUF58 domain-containing protein n=1 Tax=Arthrobacter sp. NPDC090010 TaxID=3363942 RepID=UPI003815DF66